MAEKLQVLHRFWLNLTARIKNIIKRLIRTIDAHPLRSFWLLLGTLLALIIIGNVLRQPPKAKEVKAPTPKPVKLFSIGSAPKMTLQAKIEKSGAIKLISQSAGIVQSINISEGDTVTSGENLFWLSTNVYGGTLPTLTRQIAQKNAEFASDNFDLQLEMINKRRDITNKTNEQAADLRDITSKSKDETSSLISLNDEILSSLNTQLDQLESNNATGSANALILQTKQAKAGVQAALNSLRSAQRNAGLQTDTDKPPAQLADLTRDLTLKQLDLEERSLKLNREISSLNLRVAQVSESLMYPASVCSGIVERIHVQFGQTVSPGTLLATLTCDKNTATAVVMVPDQLAKSISRIERSTLIINSRTVTLLPRYISQEPTEGTLHSVLFTLPDEVGSNLTNGSIYPIQVPIGNIHATSSDPFVPIDALYQTQTDAYVYVASPSASNTFVASSRKVTLGSLFGEFIEVVTGLTDNDQVILNRNVIEGDLVTVE